MINNIHIALNEQYELPEIKESNRDDWVEYGEDNNYYQWLIDRYVNSPTNNAVINNINKLIYGKGLSCLDASKKPTEYAQMVTLFRPECIRQIIGDLKMLGQCALQVVYNEDKSKIVEVYHVPVQLLRCEKCNEEGEIMGYYFSNDWTDIKKNPPERFSAFGTSKDSTEILYIKPYSVGLKYYSYVDYQGGLPYTLLEQEIGTYLINEVQGGFSGTKIVNFNNGIPDENQREQISRDVINKLTGTQGRKTIVAFNHDETSRTTIDDVSLNDAPSHYEYLADECLRKILLSHNVTSPLLFGIATTTGFGSNSSELRDSFILYYNMVIKPYQETIIDALDKILGYNQISLDLYFKTLKPLEFTNDEGEVEEDEDKESRLSEDEYPIDLTKYGHKKEKNWVLIDEFDVDLEKEEELDQMIELAQKKANEIKPKKLSFRKRMKGLFLVSTGDPKPKRESEQDKIIDGMYFITRYRYLGDISNNSRPFCKAMIKADLLYRKEDIVEMSSDSVNKGWGLNGSDNYDIFKYKGGGNCHHLWRRRTYVGLDTGIPLDYESKEAEYISTTKAQKMGYRFVNPREVSVMPKDMKDRGFVNK